MDIIKKQKLEQDFKDAIGSGIDSFKRAGDILVNLVKDDPKYIEKAHKKFGVSKDILVSLYRIGCGNLLPEFFAAPPYIRRLPVYDQQLLKSGSVEAIVMRGDGTQDTVTVDVIGNPNVSKDIVKQVFRKDGIRTLAEQKSFLISSANKKAVIESVTKNTGEDPTAQWYRRGSSIIIPKNSPVVLNKQTLKNMLSLLSK